MLGRLFLPGITFLMVLIISLALRTATNVAAEGQSYYLFTSFRSNGEDGLHLALSRDGYYWRALDQDRSYLKPTVGKGQLMRDPCIAQDAEGIFHMVWTTGWWDQTIGYASSKDLIRWDDQRAIPVMAHEPKARNAWAPELFYDDFKRQWLIFWASTIPGKFPATDQTEANGKNHRIYYTTTKDFKTFSATRLFFDPGFNVIDATLLKVGPKYYLFFKDEREVPIKKNIRFATADSVEGPYGQISEPITKDWVEGPSAIKITDEWFVYFDQYREHRYGAIKSRDLKHWEDISKELSFPSDHRHGSILKISKALAERLSGDVAKEGFSVWPLLKRCARCLCTDQPRRSDSRGTILEPRKSGPMRIAPALRPAAALCAAAERERSPAPGQL